MTHGNKELFEPFPPGFSAKRYRATPEQIERNKRENRIQREKDERAWRELIEEGKVPPGTELQGLP